jgi:hypothetical protein
MALQNYSIVHLLISVLVCLNSAFQASGQFINAQCAEGCFYPAGNPLATPVACRPGALVTQQPTPTTIIAALPQFCDCAGPPGYVRANREDYPANNYYRGIIVCTMCASTMTPGYILSHCPDGGIPGPPSAPANAPSCVYPNNKYTEPTMNGYGPVTDEIHQKLVDASELASLAYCTDQIISDPLSTWQCPSFFCSQFPGMKILFVCHRDGLASLKY